LINQLLIFAKKVISNYKRIPSFLVGRMTIYLHNKKYTSNTKTTPSKIGIDNVSNFLDRVGVRKGDVLFVHSSWENLNSGLFGAPDLIKSLLNTVGDEGTLAMPAIPDIAQVPGATFNVRRTPSAAGMLTEVFRRYPNVKRSINLNHSVCAFGPQAEFLIKDHHLSETSWDKNSPYFRLSEFENSWIVGLGVGHRLQVATSLHCVESALCKDSKFFKKLFANQICYEYKDSAGEAGQHCYRQRTGQIYTQKIAKHFTKDELIEETIDGLEVYAIKAKTLIEKSIDLGREGKTMYVWPIPWPWFFKNK